MRMVPVVLRLEFQGIHFFGPQGYKDKAYDFVGRGPFFLTLTKARMTDTCGRVIGGSESFGQELC